MRRYILHRIIVLIPVLFLVSVAVFSLVHFIPGDPIDYMFSQQELANPQTRAELERALGLDKPLYLQYVYWMGRIFHGDFGNSIHYARPNADLISERFPATLLLTISASIISLLIAIPAGIVAAIKRNTAVDYLAMVFALLGTSIPNFWLGILLILAFSLYLPLLPSSGYVASFLDPLGTLKTLLLPSITLGAGMAAIVARMTRSEMLEEIGKEYVRTARAKGMPEHLVIVKHTLKNALTPTITVVGLQLGHLLGGAVIVESVFSWPGIGSLAVEAIYSRDYSLIQGIVLLFAVIYVSINFVVDILYKYVNPRITLE